MSGIGCRSKYSEQTGKNVSYPSLVSVLNSDGKFISIPFIVINEPAHKQQDDAHENKHEKERGEFDTTPPVSGDTTYPDTDPESEKDKN